MTDEKLAEPARKHGDENGSMGNVADQFNTGLPDSDRYFDPPASTQPGRATRRNGTCDYQRLLTYMNRNMRPGHNHSDGNKRIQDKNGGTQTEGNKK
uniref:Uncharacterized protein n=1 Tax=Trichuris muris TaxID=70415 RepID=A0A5S6QD50_TRIMR